MNASAITSMPSLLVPKAIKDSFVSPCLGPRLYTGRNLGSHPLSPPSTQQLPNHPCGSHLAQARWKLPRTLFRGVSALNTSRSSFKLTRCFLGPSQRQQAPSVAPLHLQPPSMMSSLLPGAGWSTILLQAVTELSSGSGQPKKK